MRNLIPVIMTLMLAMIFALLPMPQWAVWARPAWVLLVLIYWTLNMPQLINVGFAWSAGICLDVLMGTMLGEHALALTVVIYLVYRSHLRIMMYPILQQTFNVLIYVLSYQVIIYCIQGFIGEEPLSRYYWLSTVTSVALWPWLSFVMRDYCQWVRVDLAK